MIIWLSTIVCNLILVLLLLYQGHYQRYKVFFLAVLFELIAAPFLHFSYTHFGTDSTSYYVLFHVKKMGTIIFSLGIIFEGWMWRNKCLHVPQEIYTFSLITALLAEKVQLIFISDSIHGMLRYINIAITVWWMYCFFPESPKERRYFRFK